MHVIEINYNWAREHSKAFHCPDCGQEMKVSTSLLEEYGDMEISCMKCKVPIKLRGYQPGQYLRADVSRFHGMRDFSFHGKTYEMKLCKGRRGYSVQCAELEIAEIGKTTWQARLALLRRQQELHQMALDEREKA